MSLAVKLRVVALRIIGVTLLGSLGAGIASVGSVAAPITTMSVLVPIVADAGDGQLLGADELETETAPGGDWTILADTAARHGLTLALDSRIIASIAALGNDAPASVVSWLDGVTAEKPLILPWGNADVWALTPVGSIDFSASQFGSMAGVDAAALVAWPSGSVIQNDSLSLTAARGFLRVIAGDDVLAGGFDSASSRLLAEAVSPKSAKNADLAASDVVASLRNGSGIVLPSQPENLDAGKARDVLDVLARSGIRVTRFAPLSTNPTRVPLRTAAGPATLAQVLAAMASDHERARTITEQPDALVINRIHALAVVTRNVADPNFDATAQGFLADTNWLSRLVSISLASEYTVLSNTAEVPVSVSNDSLATVTIDVRVRSTSGIVHVDSASQTVTIEPRSNVRITVPMTAVANGRTALVASLSDSSGLAIGTPVVFPIEVQAQWEILTVVVFFGSVVVIMTIGIIRTIRRRRANA